ncbi:MAG TPA: ribulose-phosphate 3-epimerase [Candidatus Babeliales bacterium]|nr:ribulose-phosphate 3-epimerase [Candidatus Babeliales bacterium]
MKSIFPSLISSDLLNLESTITALDPHCAGYHIDIMDNHFVPNLTWGTQFLNAIARKTSKQIWAHLMVENPESLLETMTIPTGSIVSIHIETKKEIIQAIKSIRGNNWRPSITINPKTDIAACFQLLDEQVDHILIMSVEPGHSGQNFLPITLQKLETLATYRAQHNLSFTIAIDGGINETNIQQLAQHGADDFAIASGIFASENPINQLTKLTKLISE